MKKHWKKITLALFLVSMVFVLTGCAADGTGVADELTGMLGNRSTSLQIIALITILSLAPSLLILLTGFTRIIIVLSFTRNALGMQQMPPNQVLMGLALILTFFVMSPVFTTMYEQAYLPYTNQQLTPEQATDAALVPLREFMLRQTYRTDLEMFMGVSKSEAVDDPTKVPTKVLVPAFITSEIKRGFQIGFFIYIPFIVIDMIVASTLMAMGMMMLPPVIISLPFKVLLFIAVDGWLLTMQTLVGSFL